MLSWRGEERRGGEGRGEERKANASRCLWRCYAVVWNVSASSVARVQALRVVRGDGKGTRGHIWATLFLGWYKYGDLALQVGGVSRTGQYNMVLGPAGLRWLGPAATVNYRPVLSSERALQNPKPASVKKNFKEKEKLVAGPRWVLDTKTDWPSDCRS
jgi:hypothetical protein